MLCVCCCYYSWHELGDVGRSRAVQALRATERMSVCIVKASGSLRGFKRRGQNVTVGDGQ